MARRSLEDGVYIVQKGDTLSAIAKAITGDANNYKELANINNIANPNLIFPGQIINIPQKYDAPLDYSQIPSKKEPIVINDYSPNFKYIVEGDKIYYSKKNRNDYWVDISDNDKARTNLFNHIKKKDFIGYGEEEKDIYNKLQSNSFNYPQYHDSIQNVYKRQYENYIKQRDKKKNRPSINIDLQQQPIVYANDAIKAPYISTQKRTVQQRKGLKDYIAYAKDFLEKGKNYIKRQYEKRVGDSDKTSNLVLPELEETQSAYGIIPQSYTGDTVFYNNSRQYIIPESIDLTNTKLGVRNRGDNTPINTEGAIITNFNPYKPANSYKGDGTYMGIDSQGNFKVGKLSEFNPDDMVTRTFANNVVSFDSDNDGQIKFKDDASHGNPGRGVPVVNVLNDKGELTKGSLNILTSKNKNDAGTYGTITGGRVILESDNERRLVSGSINDIKAQFEDMKKRHNADYVTIYTLDNGSYNRALRTKDKKLTETDLQKYDRQNTGGGNFMYIQPSVSYPSDTIFTPNIRTEKDESYIKGHSLENGRQGIVLHHTAFMDPDLSAVLQHLTNPQSQASSHVVIGYNGERKVLANPDKVTFHAGQSMWNGRDNVNDFMLGIEFQGDTNKKDLTNDQINSAIEYMLPIIRDNNISLENIVTHEQVRDLYNDYVTKTKQGKVAPAKHDINQRNYEKIINELKRKLYYKK